MKTPRKRSAKLFAESLETRCLLSGAAPSGRWVGQDQHDVVGRSSAPGPSGIQDIHIVLDNLPTTRSITSADVQGHGGGQWLFNGRYGPWAAMVAREAGSSSADVYIEPYQIETGRKFTIDLNFDDGTSTRVSIAGGSADPGLRMPSSAARVLWVGQNGSDRVGTGPSVGPDGRLDAVLALSNLPADVGIDRVTVTGSGELAWQYGTNTQADSNAEIVRNPSDPSRVDLYIQPDVNLQSQSLLVHLYYSNGTTDQVSLVAGATDPNLLVSTPAPVSIRADALSAVWNGQSNPISGVAGDVSATVSGLATDRAIIAATLTNETRGVSWAYKADPRAVYFVEQNARPLAFRRDADPSKAQIAFPPVRDETGDILTLRITYDDGTMSVARFAGGAVDLSLRAPKPLESSIVARPGDNLQALVDTYGTVHLSPGEYRLTQPLVLNKPVRLVGEAGTTLVFEQPISAPLWTAAIKIHQGNTTLENFAVRFAGPVRWNLAVPYASAVIGTTDPLDSTAGGLKVNLTIRSLDLEAPPVVPSSSIQESPKLLRLVTAESGQILGNRLHGGTTEFMGGPWTIAGNTYTGTGAGTRVFDVFAGHWTHDVRIEDNTARSEPGSGKTYRFLVLTGSGDNNQVVGNTVEGIGPRDDDTVPNPNAPETILTEAYRIRFEGRPLAISSNGRIVQIPTPQGEAIRAGDVVAVLSGPDAGQWRRVAQVINPTTLLLEAPLPTESPITSISVSTGFVNLSIRNNVIDVRGSQVAAPLVLVGAQFGTDVLGNRFRGGAGSRVVSKPSEQPVHWGWSHTPVFDAEIRGNTFEDALIPLTIGVDRNGPVKSSKTRVYFEGELTGNVVAWSSAFLASGGLSSNPIGFRIGSVRALDPMEVMVDVQDNAMRIPAGVTPAHGIEIHVSTVNGQEIVDQYLPLPLLKPARPEGLRLFQDTGERADDGITNNPQLVFDAPSASRYEYRLAGWNTFLPIDVRPGQPFVPPGLVDGTTTVELRAVDLYGQASDSATLSFTLDTTAPAAPLPLLSPASDTGASNIDRITRDAQPVLIVQAEPSSQVVLLDQAREVGRRTGAGLITVSPPLPDGPHRLSILVTDLAGNQAQSPELPVTIDTVAPIANPPAMDPGSDTGLLNHDRMTRTTQPVFWATAAGATETITLLSNGVEVARRVGPGPLIPAAPLPEGAQSVGIQVADLAGNVATSPPILVNIDTTPPTAVSGLRDAGGGQITFTPHSDAVNYEYRVGLGPFIPAAATTIRPSGLLWGPNVVVVRAIDGAGNPGAESTVIVNLARPRGVWMGQTNRTDLVGPWSNRSGPDGFADIQIAVLDLPADREIVYADIQRKGGDRWQFGNPRNEHWQAAVVRTPGGNAANIYIQPARSDTGREYQVALFFNDGSSTLFYVQGGRVDSRLRSRVTPVAGVSGGLGAPVPASSNFRAPQARRQPPSFPATRANAAGSSSSDRPIAGARRVPQTASPLSERLRIVRQSRLDLQSDNTA